jgi:hypothetical protein
MALPKPKNKKEAKAISIIRAAAKKRKGLLGMLEQMAGEREFEFPLQISDYVAMLIEEADFSFECDLIEDGKLTLLNAEDAADLLDAAAAARYSAMLWETAAKVVAISPDFMPTAAPKEKKEPVLD